MHLEFYGHGLLSPWNGVLQRHSVGNRQTMSLFLLISACEVDTVQPAMHRDIRSQRSEPECDKVTEPAEVFL